ncbi:hypothetical protein BH24BAC1_BH24BAC1_01270 [soil metagenome]
MHFDFALFSFAPFDWEKNIGKRKSIHPNAYTR